MWTPRGKQKHMQRNTILSSGNRFLLAGRLKSARVLDAGASKETRRRETSTGTPPGGTPSSLKGGPCGRQANAKKHDSVIGESFPLGRPLKSTRILDGGALKEARRRESSTGGGGRDKHREIL